VSATDVAFYSTAATVIPVLFLVVVLEARWLPRRRVEPTSGMRFVVVELAGPAFILLMMALGEATSLIALSTGDQSGWLKTLTAVSLYTVGLALMLAAIDRVFTSLEERVGESQRGAVSTARSVAEQLVGTLSAVGALIIVLNT
jgi:hypothetical protein